jgi:hypothetical protein
LSESKFPWANDVPLEEFVGMEFKTQDEFTLYPEYLFARLKLAEGAYIPAGEVNSSDEDITSCAFDRSRAPVGTVVYIRRV